MSHAKTSERYKSIFNPENDDSHRDSNTCTYIVHDTSDAAQTK